MPLTITIKPMDSSNKPQTIPHKGDIKLLQGLPPRQHPIPFIDKISVTLKVPTIEMGHDMWKAHWMAVQDHSLFHQMHTAGKGYRKAYQIALPSVPNSKHWPHYQIGFHEQGTITKVRIEFVPVDLGSAGLEDLHFALIALVEDGWAYFVKNGRITRLDIAIDLPEASMEDFHFLPQQGAWHSQWSCDGRLMSMQQGKPNSNQTMIYDRGQKRKDKGQDWLSKQGVRVERRLRSQSMSFSQLKDLQNPFSAFALVKRIVGPPVGHKKDGYVWPLFMAKVEAAGLAVALAGLPTTKKTAYRKHLKQHLVSWWTPEAFWAGWANMLADLKIAEVKSWG